MLHPGFSKRMSAALRATLTCIVALSLVFVPFGHPLPVQADTPATITVTVTEAGSPLPGAFVALMDDVGAAVGGAVTNAAGQVVFTAVDPGDYHLVASAPGTRVGDLQNVQVTDQDLQLELELEDSGNRFRGLGAYGSQTGTIVADGLSGVFYLNTTTIPSLFRTADYGATWAPVTVQDDDQDHGLTGLSNINAIVTSGYPGEIAGLADGKVWYSRDFGVTWQTIDLPPATDQVFWGHVDDDITDTEVSILLASSVSNTNMHFALMPTGPDDPALTFQPIENSYKAKPNDKLWIANGSQAPVLAVASASGNTVTLYSLEGSPAEVTTPPIVVDGAAPAGAPTFVRLGGPATGPEFDSGNRAPNTILVFSFSDEGGSAVLSTYSEGDWVHTSQTVFKMQDNETDAPDGRFTTSCGAGYGGVIGSVAPTGGAGTVAMCWVTQLDDTGTVTDTMIVRPVQGINNNTGMAFDAGFDGTTNTVMISGDGSKGAVKSASFDPELRRPIFPQWPEQAGPGIDPSSGGVAVHGIEAAVVRDTTVGPAADELAAILSFTGGGRTVASVDRGDTWVTIAATGGEAIDWWQGADSEWILAGSGGDGHLLGALAISDAAPLAADSELVFFAGTSASDLGLPQEPGHNYYVSAIAGIPGADEAFVGSIEASQDGSTGTIRRVTVALQSEPQIYGTGFDSISNPVNALAYCPAGSHESVAGRLYAALGETTTDSFDGTIAVFDDAATSPVAVDVEIDAQANFTDVRVDCTTGDVWATAVLDHNGPAPSGLFHSTDGGNSFEAVDFSGTSLAGNPETKRLATLSLNSDNPEEVVVVSLDYLVFATSDGGSTWTVINDPSEIGAKHFGAERPGDIEAAPPTPAPYPGSGALGAAAAEGPSTVLLASGAGLFEAVIDPGGGGGGDTTHQVFIPVILR